MALRRKKEEAQTETKEHVEPTPEVEETTAAAAPEPEPEVEETTAAAAPEPEEEAAPEPESIPKASPPATRKQAPPPSTGVSASKMMNNMLFSELENGFIAEYGTMPRLKASNGNILDGDNNVLGTWVTGQVLSWNKRYVISPGTDKAPTDLVAFSWDGITLDDGSGDTVADYIAMLKRSDYPDAACKEYYDLVMHLQTSEKPSELVDGLVSVQLSPTSRKDFDSFRLQTSFKIAQGLVSPESVSAIKIGTKLVTNASNQTWTKFIFSTL